MGQTLDCVGIYLPDPVFSHSQLYVAMSRARSFKNGKIETRSGSKASNVARKEVLQGGKKKTDKICASEAILKMKF